MIHHNIRQRQFINTCIDILSAQYSQNTIRIRQLISSSYDVPDPVTSLLNIHAHLYKPSDINEVNKLVREQIKINKLIITGKDMLKCNCICQQRKSC